MMIQMIDFFMMTHKHFEFLAVLTCHIDGVTEGGAFERGILLAPRATIIPLVQIGMLGGIEGSSIISLSMLLLDFDVSLRSCFVGSLTLRSF